MFLANSGHKLLVANRGEIAVRIIRTAKELGIPTIAIYTPTDALSPHVSLASIAVALPISEPADPAADSRGYLDGPALLDICRTHGATLVHPGYGFLSENEDFARMLHDAGIAWLGPHPDVIRAMGLKHEARRLAAQAGVPVVRGSKELLCDVGDAVREAVAVGFPVMLKSTAGGGGMGLVVCGGVDELNQKFKVIQTQAQVLFKNDGLFLERYVPASRHVEVQVFGNGLGHVVHFGERECSVQRRHQKVVEETPSPFMVKHPDVRQKMCAAAVRLCQKIKYASAGTCEFLVDDYTGEFYFLEMNTRLQVEHPITEAVRPGLDIVKLMILQGVAQRDPSMGGLDPSELDQQANSNDEQVAKLHAIEARVYCENPAAGFKPSPGVLQHVKFAPDEDWLRVDSWEQVETGTTVTSYYDPLACKFIVTGTSRQQAIDRLVQALTESKIYGPPNNMAYLRALCNDETFRAGNAMTTSLDNFVYLPRAMEVVAGGLETTIQDYPGRLVGFGIPRSGPVDSLAARAANILVSNPDECELLEIALSGPTLRFHVPAVIAVTGAQIKVTVDGQEAATWARLVIEAGAKVKVWMLAADTKGFRAYLAVRGGFPEVPAYLGSKSTSMCLGGYQGRALAAGDYLTLGPCGPVAGEAVRATSIPKTLIPEYSVNWTIRCLAGPHGDEDFITSEGIESFYATEWKVSTSSNRMGLRLEGPKIAWARKTGGEGGSHPSNIHDNGYAFGSININGDTPVILTNEGPSMGGWKLGQLRPGNAVRFERVSFEESMLLNRRQLFILDNIRKVVSGREPSFANTKPEAPKETQGPFKAKLHVVEKKGDRPGVVFRQAGDSAILVEYGPMLLDFGLRARIHAFETEVTRRNIKGITEFAPCIRSTMCHYDYNVISQHELLQELISAEDALPGSTKDLVFPSRKITFPIVLDDRWNREALQRYMNSIRSKAVYLPSNIEYLANNNGLDGGADEALKLLLSSDWIVFGVGFYLGCPFLVPIDPRKDKPEAFKKKNPEKKHSYENWSPRRMKRKSERPTGLHQKVPMLAFLHSDKHADDNKDDISPGGQTITSSLTAIVFKINVKAGDVIRSAEDVVVVLEAMKTEIPVEAVLHGGDSPTILSLHI
ncbi:hypothetical protein EWM64_g5490 [Hericium alpestre]|uniref:Urea carboxylase n=1 Tax=Hericium alpestre TaxID=135208 RepID=A0A4Y9ZUQ3_9AGAM|nr:hypothetical protein EWM64_g5490 [Hericium alpestre]